jgi:hypothetical protein
MEDRPDSEADNHDGSPTRRRLLMLGAASASMVVTIRPALAQTGGSILNCEIPVPDPSSGGSWIASDGSLVPADTPGAFPPAGRPLTGEEVRAALQGSSLPGVDPETSKAYTNYVRRLQSGMSGFTCYASLQMPGR